MFDCYNNSNRRVGIAFSSHQKLRDYALSLRGYHRDGLIPSAYYQGRIDEVFFGAGSSIKMFDASNSVDCRGRRFDVVLYDPEIYDKVTLEWLQRYENPCSKYEFKNGTYFRPVAEMEVDTQPLDDFLDGFHIMKP